MNKKTIKKIVIAIGISGVVCLGNPVNAGEINEVNVPTLEESESSVVQYIKVGDYTFDISEIEVVEKNSYREASKGYKFFSIDVSVTNTSDMQDQITSSNVFKIRDENDNYYNVIMPEEIGLNGLVNPGETLKGTIVFEVKENSEEFTMRIKPWFNEDYVEYVDFTVE